MKIIHILLLSLTALTVSLPAQADEELKPFIIASQGAGDKAAMVAEVKGKLTAAGFDIVGEYSPYDTVTVIAVTNAALKDAAAASEHGAYAAAQRVAVSVVKGELQVSYTNPVYMSHVYRMDADLAGVRQQMAAALGEMGEYGPGKGLSPNKLRKYHYTFGMQYVTDPDKLAEYDSHEAAVTAVERGLAAKAAGVSKVYRIDLGADKSVFGVAMTEGKTSDAYIMSEIDFKDVRSSAHLPYEIQVKGNEVYALNARFRIAINFPDLSMMGANSFMNIMSSPGAIKDALTKVAQGG